MTALLSDAIDRAVALPDAEQDQVAEALLAALDAADDRQWDAQFAASHDVLSLLADEAVADDDAGRTVPLTA